MSDDFLLTADNYYSKEANERYMSVHQFLDFVGYMGVEGCEARALATLRGEYQPETTIPMLVGSYVDSAIEGTLDKFKLEHPEIFTQKGELKAQYRQAEKMLERMRRDKYFMRTLSGKKQVIMTANLFGCDWKIKMDSYIKDTAIVDLKTTGDLHKAWRISPNEYATVVEYWAYVVQGAVYQKVVEINTGNKLPFFLSFVTKEDDPELCVVSVDQETLDNALEYVRDNMESVLLVKNGEVQPQRCEKCAHCKRTAVLHKAINYRELILGE